MNFANRPTNEHIGLKMKILKFLGIKPTKTRPDFEPNSSEILKNRPKFLSQYELGHLEFEFD